MDFTAFYADDPSIISTILTHRELDVDAAVVTALHEKKRLDVIQRLLRYKAASGPFILSPPNLQNMVTFRDQPDDNRGLRHVQSRTYEYPHLLAGQLYVRPLCVIARSSRRGFWNEDERNLCATVDFFISRGEDINGLCEPFGTALHAAVSSPQSSEWTIGVIRVLLDRGAHVNAYSSLGTPLELAWSRLRKSHTNPYYGNCSYYHVVVETLIKHGGENNRPDPEGGVPSVDQMIAFCPLNSV